MTTRPSLETIAGLYKAAYKQQQAADVAMFRVLESAHRHGYTEKQVAEKAGLTISARVKQPA